MRDIAIISLGQTDHTRQRSDVNEVEMLMPVLASALEGANITKDRVDFVSLLFSRPRPKGVDTSSSADALFRARAAWT